MQARFIEIHQVFAKKIKEQILLRPGIATEVLTCGESRLGAPAAAVLQGQCSGRCACSRLKVSQVQFPGAFPSLSFRRALLE